MSNLAASGLNPNQKYISWSHEAMISGPHACMYMPDLIFHLTVHHSLSQSPLARKLYFCLLCIRVFFFLLLLLSIWLIISVSSLWLLVSVLLIIYTTSSPSLASACSSYCGTLGLNCGSTVLFSCDHAIMSS